MTQRERKIAIGLLAGLGALAVLGGFWRMFLEPLKKRNLTIANLRNERDDRETELAKKRAERLELKRLTALSMPADPNPRHLAYDLAWGEYDKYLRQLMRDNRLRGVRITGTAPVIRSPVGRGNANKKPVYLPLTYTVEATGELTSIVAMLEDFYKTPLLQQIKSLSIKPVATTGRRPAAFPGFAPAARELTIKMTVEGLLVDGAPKRSQLMVDNQPMLAVNGLLALRHGISGLPLVPWTADSVLGRGLVKPQPLTAPVSPGEYATIVRKNIFVSPVAPAPASPSAYPNLNINDHIRLTSVIHSGDSWEAFVYDVFNNIDTRLWAKERPLLWFGKQKMLLAFQTFASYETTGNRKSIKVYRIDPQDVYFYTDLSWYRMHLGDTLTEALDRGALEESEVEALGLPEDPTK